MDDKQIDRILSDIEDLKRAVKRNKPLLSAVASPPGWKQFVLASGLAITAFSLPAHVLQAQYGSLAGAPLGWRAYLVAVCATFIVAGGIIKVMLMGRGAGSLGKAMGAFYAGSAAHIIWPMSVLMLTVVTATIVAGRPWFALSAMAMGFAPMSNFIALRTGVKAYYGAGYWGMVSGLASLPFVERWPFLCLFTVWGGMFFAMAALLFAQDAARKREGQDVR